MASEAEPQSNRVTVSVPAAQGSKSPAAPSSGEGEVFARGTWAGLAHFTCLWKTKHMTVDENGEPYEVTCNLTFFSEKAMLDHLRLDH